MFSTAAAIPCCALLLFCGFAIHEWWLISTHQIVVTPALARGASSAPEVPASRLLPLIIGSGLLAAAFAYSLLRGSMRVLIGAWLAVALVVVVPYFVRLL